MNCDKEMVHILVLKTLARFRSKDTQIFFQEKRDPVTGVRLGIKEPVTLFINNAGDFNEFPLECVQCVIVRTDEPTWTSICGKKIRISIGFKVLLLVKFSGSNTFELITLPDDIGTSVTTLYDLSEVQVSQSIIQTMQRVGDRFIYTITIPFNEFDGTPPADENFNVIITLRNMTWNAEIGDTGFNGTGSPPVPSTRVDLAIFYDILVQIAIETEITMAGTVE
jgi:hypothetical protein